MKETKISHEANSTVVSHSTTKVFASSLKRLSGPAQVLETNISSGRTSLTADDDDSPRKSPVSTPMTSPPNSKPSSKPSTCFEACGISPSTEVRDFPQSTFSHASAVVNLPQSILSRPSLVKQGKMRAKDDYREMYAHLVLTNPGLYDILTTDMPVEYLLKDIRRARLVDDRRHFERFGVYDYALANGPMGLKPVPKRFDRQRGLVFAAARSTASHAPLKIASHDKQPLPQRTPASSRSNSFSGHKLGSYKDINPSDSSPKPDHKPVSSPSCIPSSATSQAGPSRSMSAYSAEPPEPSPLCLVYATECLCKTPHSINELRTSLQQTLDKHFYRGRWPRRRHLFPPGAEGSLAALVRLEMVVEDMASQLRDTGSAGKEHETDLAQSMVRRKRKCVAAYKFNEARIVSAPFLDEIACLLHAMPPILREARSCIRGLVPEHLVARDPLSFRWSSEEPKLKPTKKAEKRREKEARLFLNERMIKITRRIILAEGRARCMLIQKEGKAMGRFH